MAFSAVNLLCQIVFASVFSSTFVRGLEREIESCFNPGCGNCSEFFVHVAAKGPDDTLHFLWDFTHKPSMLLALTNHSATLSVNWTDYGREGSVHFDEAALYSFGIVINKIWEYNDVNDTGIFNPSNSSSSYVHELPLKNFLWSPAEYKNDSRSATVGVKVEFDKDNRTSKKGTILIEFQSFGFLGHSEALPHLLHTANTSQVDITIDGLQTDSNFSNSRFAVELVLVSSDRLPSPEGDHLHICPKKSLDDEHAPGVFTLVDVKTPQSAAAAQGGYLQWRPVAYRSSLRDISNSTDTNVYNPVTVSDPAEYLAGSLLPSYFSFSNSADTQLLIQATNISFGVKEDGFYRKTNFTAWTFTVGYGAPPDEDFSLLVILVIGIGLGLPALLIVCSGLVMLIRRIKQRKEDLFQGR